MEIVNAALCSYGMSGLTFHGPLLEAHPGFKITKILERRKRESEGKHKEAIIVRDYDQILADPEIRLIVVNTPDHLHFEMALAAIKAGKHVVVEKPFTHRTDHASQLITMARERGVILTVFQNRRWDGDFMTVKEIIDSGKLGRLVDYESHFDRYRLEIQKSWKDQSGTGTLYNLGSHLVDQALQLFGMPDRLFCDNRILRDGAKTDDSFDLFLHYPDFKCLLRSSYLVMEPGPRYILHGTTGSYLKWGIDPQEEDLKKGGVPGSKNWGEEPESAWGKISAVFEGSETAGRYPTLKGDYMAFYENVYRAIVHGDALAVTAEQARDTIRIIEAAYLSAREGRVVVLST